MQFDAHCMACLVDHQLKLALKKDDGVKADAYLREVMQAILDAPKGVSAPWLTNEFTKLYQKYWPGEDAYGQLKEDSNRLVLELLPQIRPLVENAEDPLAMALKFARTGNFLDFGILTPEVAHEALWKAVEETPEMVLDSAVYDVFCRELEGAEMLLILGDNAGEIVFDTLLVEALRERYPHLRVVYGVRGKNTLNDATRVDAHLVGMDRLAEIVDSGSAISGTELEYLSEEMAQAIRKADVILSKGSGNFESLAGCGLNIYYVFMCKCPRVAKILGCENMTPHFLREKTLERREVLVGKL